MSEIFRWATFVPDLHGKPRQPDSGDEVTVVRASDYDALSTDLDTVIAERDKAYGEVDAMKKDTARLREILIDWYVAVDVQRYTGEPFTRNGVEQRMFAIGRELFAASRAPADGEKL